MKKLALVALLALAALLVVTIIVGAVVTGRLRDQREAARRAAAPALEGILGRYRADQEALAGHWLMASTAGPDASAVMHARVPFQGAATPIEPGFGIPPATVEAVKRLGVDWAGGGASLDLASIDLAWLSGLPAFGFWDVEAEGSPMNVRPWNWATVPIPDFTGLMVVQKARLLQGLARGDLPAAFLETRALARLCASTELLVGVMVAAAMVKNEARFVAELQRRGIDPGVADPTTDEVAAQIGRVMYAAPAAFQLDEPTPGLEQAVVVGRCAGLGEGLASSDLVRPLLRDSAAARYSQLDQLLASSPCRLKNLRATWGAHAGQGRRESLAEFCRVLGGEGELIVCTMPGLWAALPFARSAAGEMLMAVAAPDWFKRYRTASPSSSSP